MVDIDRIAEAYESENGIPMSEVEKILFKDAAKYTIDWMIEKYKLTV